jgi:hypothetical protein
MLDHEPRDRLWRCGCDELVDFIDVATLQGRPTLVSSPKSLPGSYYAL